MDEVDNAESSSPADTRDDHKFDAVDAVYYEDSCSIINHSDEDYEGEDEAEVKERYHEEGRNYQLESQQSLIIEGKSFDYGFSERERDDEEEEEEETRDDVSVYPFSPFAYDLKRFGDEPLKEEEREEMIDKLKDLFFETKVLMVANQFLHKKYINAMRNSTALGNALEKFDETSIFEDNRYQTVLEKYSQTRDEINERQTYLRERLQDLEQTYAIDQADFATNFENLINNELTIAKRIKPPKMHQEIWLEEVDHLLRNQRNRVTDVSKIRLTHIRLLNKLETLKKELQQFDSLGPGFSMMDFEYLQKRKEIYRDRRDEQMEQIKKLEEKNLSCAAAVKHIDEEAHLFDGKVDDKSEHLNVLTQESKIERSKAVELASKKVSIAQNIAKLKEEIGLLNYPFLLKKMYADTLEISRLKKRSVRIQSLIVTNSKKIQGK